MSAARNKDTKPELDVRRILHAHGLRYRVGYAVPDSPRRTIDIAFTRAKVAVFLDGCFWHRCPDHGTRPRSNPEWWDQKLAANTARDADTNRLLVEAGWTVLRFWEHDDARWIAERIESAIRS